MTHGTNSRPESLRQRVYRQLRAAIETGAEPWYEIVGVVPAFPFPTATALAAPCGATPGALLRDFRV